MGDRNSELQAVMGRMLSRDFTKIAQGEMMPPPDQGGMPPMDTSMPPMMGGGMQPMMGAGMPPMDGGMMPPEMMPPMGGGMPPMEGGMPPFPPVDDSGDVEAAKGMKDVAMKALDMAQDTISAVLSANQLSPEAMSDAAASTVSSSGALSGIPAEEISALA
jgi:hypothetical protein